MIGRLAFVMQSGKVHKNVAAGGSSADGRTWEVQKSAARSPRRPTRKPCAPKLVVSAHMDTVFAEGTDVKVKEIDGRFDALGRPDARMARGSNFS